VAEARSRAALAERLEEVAGPGELFAESTPRRARGEGAAAGAATASPGPTSGAAPARPASPAEAAPRLPPAGEAGGGALAPGDGSLRDLLRRSAELSRQVAELRARAEALDAEARALDASR
jgi:hypothetical protein